MLLEKYDPQSPSIIFSSQLPTNDQPTGRPSITKLPKISHVPSNQNHGLNTDFLMPLNNRSAVYVPQLDKISPTTFENPIGRGPKIYTKNLPDVFTSGSTANRVKKHPGIKERNKGDYADQLSVEIATPTTNKAVHKVKLQPFLNPIHIGQLPDTKGSQKTGGKVDFYTPSMKENIEGFSLKHENENHYKGLNLSKDENFPSSPSRRSRRIRIRTNIEYGPLLDNTNLNSGRNIPKEDDMKKQIKNLVMFKKKASNTSESKFFDAKSEELRPRLVEGASSLSGSTAILQLNELITIRKMNTTIHNGVIKRMLHVPSFKLFDVLEESITDITSKESYDIKDWINSWKVNFSRSKYMARVYSCFWNSPEGCVSIVCESAKHGSLNDLIELYGSLPEKSIQNVTREILHGLVELHSKSIKPHGNISPREIIIDSKGTLKISPGISHLFPKHSLNNLLEPPKSPRTIEIRTSSKFLSSHADGKFLSHADFSQDIFDFGFALLQCALGDFSMFNLDNSLTLESIKQAIGNLTLHKKSDACCLLHSEDLIRKSLSLNVPRRNAKKGKKFKAFDDLDKSSNSDTPVMTFYETLLSMNRFSEHFISFLCSCLQLDPLRRPKAETLLNHRFLNDIHFMKGPQVSFKEFLGLSAKEAGDVLKNIGNEDERGFYRLEEALRVAFLNRNVKEKFYQMLRRTGRNEIEGQKITELASELGMSTHQLKRKLNECLNDLQG